MRGLGDESRAGIVVARERARNRGELRGALGRETSRAFRERDHGRLLFERERKRGRDRGHVRESESDRPRGGSA